MARNIPETRIQRILESANCLGNLQLLLGRENLEKSNVPFNQWIHTRDRDFLERHLIPNNPALWDVTALPEFVDAREALIRRRLQRFDFQSNAADKPALLSAIGSAEGN